jgi:ribose-phosphate pyrophosphokinase
MHDLSPAKIFSGSASMYLAEEIAQNFGVNLGKTTLTRFSDGEFLTSYDETVRGRYVFIIQSTFAPVDNVFELLMMVDAAKRASAYKVAAVIPYFGFARQDRKDKPRVTIGAKMMANLLQAAGVDRIMTMELHADQIQGFFDVPVDHLYSSSIFMPYIKSLNLEGLTVASPDIGGSKRANVYSKYLKTDLVICHKTRKKENVVDEMTVIGDVEGKNIILVDDIIDTAGTIAKAADMMMDKGAKSVRAVITHPVLSGPAYERIRDSSLIELITTNTIPIKHDCSKIKVLSVAELFADVIKKVYNYQSISSSFLF